MQWRKIEVLGSEITPPDPIWLFPLGPGVLLGGPWAGFVELFFPSLVLITSFTFSSCQNGHSIRLRASRSQALGKLKPCDLILMASFLRLCIACDVSLFRLMDFDGCGVSELLGVESKLTLECALIGGAM